MDAVGRKNDTWAYTFPKTEVTYNPVDINKLSTYYALSVGPNYDASNMDNSGNVIVEGNVGIGTTTPTKKLEVIGDISFNGNLYQNGTLFTGGTDITESSIADLSDVDISYSTITNGAHLIWNDIGKKWQVFNPTTTVIERSSTETRVSHTASDGSTDVHERKESPGDTWGSYDFGKVFDGTTGDNISVVHSNVTYDSNGQEVGVYNINNGIYNGDSSTTDASTTDAYTGMWVQQQYKTAIYFTRFKIHLRPGTSSVPSNPMSPKVLSLIHI